MSYAQYQSFLEDQKGMKTVRLQGVLNEDNIANFVRLHGLPFKCKDDEVKQFFTDADFEIGEECLFIEQRMGRLSGVALVQLASSDEVDRATEELNKQNIGSRFINVTRPRIDEFEDAQ